MKKKLLQLVLWIIIIQIVISGGFIAYISWSSSVESVRHNNEMTLDYIEDTLRIIKSNGSYVNDHHFVQKMNQLKGSRVTIYSVEGVMLADSLDNTLLFKPTTNVEVKDAIFNKNGETTRVDEFTKQLTFYSSRLISVSKNTFVVVLSESIEPLRSELILLVKQIIVAIFVGIVISISTGYRFVEKYTAPIIKLKESAMTISSGEYEYNLDTSAPDEVGELAEAFQSMTESIKKAVGDLSENNAYMNAILHEMFGGVIGIDMEGKVFLLNPVAEKILGISFNRIEKKHFKTIGIPIRLVETLEEVRTKTDETKHKLTLENGTVLVVQNAPIRKSNGELIGYVAVLFDITEKMKLALLQREFFTNVSHEVRTPLTSIQGFVETLEHYKALSDEDMENIISIMNYETQRLNGLICKMMEIAKLESEDSTPVMSFFPVKEIINKVIKDNIQLASHKKQIIDLYCELDEYYLLIHKESFELVLSNLISNAVKYTPNNGKIDILIEGAGENISLKIKDNGIGISKVNQEKIFNRFYRCDPSRNSKTPGYGLGLYIAMSLASSMNMTLTVDSKEGEGSVFTISNLREYKKSLNNITVV